MMGALARLPALFLGRSTKRPRRNRNDGRLRLERSPRVALVLQPRGAGGRTNGDDDSLQGPGLQLPDRQPEWFLLGFVRSIEGRRQMRVRSLRL